MNRIFLVNWVDITTLVLVASFLALIIAYIVYRKMRREKMTGCSCSKGKDMSKYYHCQKKKDCKKEQQAQNDTCCSKTDN